MINQPPQTITEELLEQSAERLFHVLMDGYEQDWDETPRQTQELYLRAARAALEAALGGEQA